MEESTPVTVCGYDRSQIGYPMAGLMAGFRCTIRCVFIRNSLIFMTYFFSFRCTIRCTFQAMSYKMSDICYSRSGKFEEKPNQNWLDLPERE